MPNNYFSLIDAREGQNDGTLVLSSDETATTILRGQVAHLVNTADGDGNNPRITVEENVVLPIGLINDALSHVYPHALTVAAGRNIAAHLIGKPCNYVHGRFRALVGDGLWNAAVTVGGVIYGDDATGKLTTDTATGANTVVIGRVISSMTVQDVAGVVYMCQFDFPV